MLRRSILKWTSLIAVPIFITLVFMSIAQRDTTQAAIKTAPQTQGSLQAIKQSGKPAGECPLKHTSVKAEVSGFLSRVTVTQQFQNPFTEKIEAVYTFPLPESAAVDDLTMIVGERTIKGKIMRRAKRHTPRTPTQSSWARSPVCWNRSAQTFSRNHLPT